MGDDWDWNGMYGFTTTGNKIISAEVYRVCDNFKSAKNGGAAWDEGATDLTVADGSLFQTDDLVWICSTYKSEGEIVKVSSVAGNVVTIAREASQFGAPNTGLCWDHTTNAAGTEVMYLAKRPGDNFWHGFEFQFSGQNAKSYARYLWHAAKRMTADCGLIVRSMNSTDSTLNTQFDLSIFYED